VDRSLALANRLREVLLNGKWIANTNFKEQLEGLDMKSALTRVGKLHTTAELVFHINYYLAGLLDVFRGGQLLIRDKFSFDLPEIKTEDDWVGLKETFISNAIAFSDAVETMEDAKLDQPFVDEQYGTYLRNIEGVIEHSYYHLGQVVLLRKLN
jgi:uncharacterized damage-inducible protein DinB